MLDDLQEHGIEFHLLTEAIDTATPTGRAMWQVIGVLAEPERSLIVERTQAGMKEARSRVVKFGRSKTPISLALNRARTCSRPPIRLINNDQRRRVRKPHVFDVVLRGYLPGRPWSSEKSSINPSFTSNKAR